MTANLSFLPVSAAKANLALGALLPADESGPHTTVYKLTSDPRYIVRVRDTRREDGRCTRSTCILERETGVVLDRLDLVSDDGGKRWQVTGPL